MLVCLKTDKVRAVLLLLYVSHDFVKGTTIFINYYDKGIVNYNVESKLQFYNAMYSTKYKVKKKKN